MIVIDCSRPDGRSSRVGVIGSCRLRTPLMKIKDQGGFEFRISKPPLTHSFAESRQVWRHATGEAPVPAALAPYIFGQPDAPAVREYPPAILDGIDTFIVEMCDSKQIHFDEWVFQNNYFARGFVQQYATQLLAWYRQFSKLRPVDPAVVDTTIKALSDAGVAELDAIESNLNRGEMRKMDRTVVIESARALVFDRSKRWIFVSHFAIPGDDRPTMRDRRELTASVEAAADELGAEFFDPTRLIEHYGREVVLRGGGTDIYEYDWDFIPVVGRIMLNMVRDGTGDALELPALDTLPPAESATPAVATDALVKDYASRVNKLLLTVGRSRLDLHGVEASGLYDHYVRLLDSGEVVRPRDVKLVAAVLDDFADFDRYHVIKAGMGAVPMMLALGGLKVDAVEGNPNRAAALREGLTALAVSKKAVGKLVTVRDGRIPAPRDGERSLVIAVGLSPGSDADRLGTQLDGHDAVIFERNSVLDLDEGDGSVLARLGLTRTVPLSANLAAASRPPPAAKPTAAPSPEKTKTKTKVGTKADALARG